MYSPDIHHRRSIRLVEYDYSQVGVYFVTICVQNRECLLGEINNGHMQRNIYGDIVANEWVKTMELRDNTKSGEWIVMPNHFHGIIQITDGGDDDDAGNNGGRGTARRAPTVEHRAPIMAHRTPTVEQFGKPIVGSLPTIIRSYKSAVTKHINELRGTQGAKLWQRNYFEHIIRNDKEHQRISEYINNNPLSWKGDKLWIE